MNESGSMLMMDVIGGAGIGAKDDSIIDFTGSLGVSVSAGVGERVSSSGGSSLAAEAVAMASGGTLGDLATDAETALDVMVTGSASMGNGVSVILVSSVSARQTSIFDSSALLILSYGAIFATGLVGNLLVILTLTRNQRGKVATNVFLLNLAVSDLLLGVFCMPVTLSGVLLRNFVFGEIMCKVIPYLQGVTVAVNAWTLVMISIERYYAVCEPLKSRGWYASSHAWHCVFVIWVFALTAMLPVFLLNRLQPTGKGRQKCREAWPEPTVETAFTVMLDLLLLVIPLAVMAFAYINITVTLRKGIRDNERSSNEIKIMGPRGDIGVMSHKSNEGMIEREPRLIVKWCRVAAPEESSESLPGHGVKIPPAEPTATQPLPTVATHDPDSSPVVDAKSPTAQCPVSASSTHREEIIRYLRTNNHEQRMAVRRKVIRMMFVVVLEFFVCWTPIYVVNTIASFSKDLLTPLGGVGISLLHLLSYVSSCCNPITYCFMNKNFRREFKRSIRCCDPKYLSKCSSFRSPRSRGRDIRSTPSRRGARIELPRQRRRAICASRRINNSLTDL
ncbi:cholecystokinin receptor type A-like [Varroa jacobsoni]|uniref:G-protein coupled receptors family 1 profile domain-containing protein n=1 Tax=Varroa destructor TaxID=109461 RepID=A0A7M7L693_VARDE|nr:cholecystokinin receptor type A-like isoform X1 [Varroa destructor]XP_022711355.1 cholecystokinin receptor type A-like [Varroa jacobsoni]XP_022711356.1 cholecystokinin receptor type A-like [Varroa jacobsoni]